MLPRTAQHGLRAACTSYERLDWLQWTPGSDSFRHLEGAQRRWPAPITAAASWPVPGSTRRYCPRLPILASSPAVISPPKKPSISNCPSMAGSQGPNGNSEVTELSSVEPVDPSTMRVCTLAEIASKSSCTPYHLPSTAGTPRSRSATTFSDYAASSCQVCVRAPASRATVGVCEGSVVPCSWLKPICIAQSRPISVPGGQPHWARSGFGSKSLKRSIRISTLVE